MATTKTTTNVFGNLKTAIDRAVKAQGVADASWSEAWKWAVCLASDENQNLSGLNLLVNAVQPIKNIRTMGLVEAVLKIGGKTSTFSGSIGYTIDKKDDDRIKFHKTRFIGEEKEVWKTKPLVSAAWVLECETKAWWDISAPEKVTPPAKFKSLIATIKRLSNGENVIMTRGEEVLLGQIQNLIVASLGSEVFDK